MAASERRIQSNRRINGSQRSRQFTNTYIDGNVTDMYRLFRRRERTVEA